MGELGIGGEQLCGAEHVASPLRLPDQLKGKQLIGGHRTDQAQGCTQVDSGRRLRRLRLATSSVTAM